MIVELDKVIFENDFAYINCNNGAIIILNKLAEDIEVSGERTLVNNVNIAYLDINNEYYNCNMAIGLSNDFFRLYTEHKDQEGKELTTANIGVCNIEVFDE